MKTKHIFACKTNIGLIYSIQITIYSIATRLLYSRQWQQGSRWSHVRFTTSRRIVPIPQTRVENHVKNLESRFRLFKRTESILTLTPNSSRYASGNNRQWRHALGTWIYYWLVRFVSSVRKGHTNDYFRIDRMFSFTGHKSIWWRAFSGQSAGG